MTTMTNDYDDYDYDDYDYDYVNVILRNWIRIQDLHCQKIYHFYYVPIS